MTDLHPEMDSRLPGDRARRPRAHLMMAAVLGALGGCDAAEPPTGSRSPVWTDGVFDDWDDIVAAAVDPVGDTPPGSPVDLGAVAVQDDPQFLHILFDTGATVTAQGMPGSVEIVLDADGDPSTGEPYGGVAGADLAIVLSRDSGGDGDAHGAGVGIRRIGPDGAGDVEESGPVGLLLAPTHSSDRFELRVERGTASGRDEGNAGDGPRVRDRAGGRPPVGTGSVVAGRLRYLRGNGVVDDTPLFTHALATEPGGDPLLWTAEDIAKAPDTHRVVAWNVASRRFAENLSAYRRVLAGLGADVVLLDELHAEVTMAELVRFGEGIPAGASPGGWSWWLASGGGSQRTAVGAGGLEVRGEAGLERVDHVSGALERWLDEAGDEPEGPDMALPSELAEAEAEGGLSATGAWVTLGEREVLFVAVDLQSAGYDGSPRDRLRELQARTLNRAVSAPLAGRPDTGIIIGGDLNLVGSARPLDEIGRGLGAGGSGLAIARPERLRDRSLATWRRITGDDPFSPGRLDYVLYRDAALEARRAFVFDAADMAADALEELGIRVSDTAHSDHLPLVVDFRPR